MKNYVELNGVLLRNFTYSHSVNDKRYYRSDIGVDRLSGYQDIIPVVLCQQVPLYRAGNRVNIKGKCVAYNLSDETGKHLFWHVKITRIEMSDILQDKNYAFLRGNICKLNLCRRTPAGRIIREYIIAINNKRSVYYVPCIAWDRIAEDISNYNIGDSVTIIGRIQSRNYIKDDAFHTVLELSTLSINNSVKSE